MLKAFSQLAVALSIGSLIGACSTQPTVRILYKKRPVSEQSQRHFSADSQSGLDGEFPVIKPKQDTQKEVETMGSSPVASEPTSIGGAYLVCLEEKTETESYALCRFENENEERIACPPSWDLNFYAMQEESKTLLGMELIEGTPFSWKINLTSMSLASLSLEIYDRDKDQTMMMAPLVIDPTTMRTSELLDPRKNKGPGEG